MARIPQHFIDELVARTDIVEVIGSRVQLKKAGREYKACCPFHDEKSPSFWVSPDKQFYHCFGCGAHGTVLSFVMEYDHLGFIEAVEDLAARAGLEVPREGGVAAGPVNPHDELYVAMERAGLYFRQCLGGDPRARDYAKRRGIDADTLQKFGIGYAAPKWDGLLERYGATDDERHVLLRGGLIIERQPESGAADQPHRERGYYDRFRDRLMFPIRDTRGRTIAFGGRILDQGEPKYLNSPETELFHKGRELYGLYEARQATRSLQRLLVVEGYMDVVSLHQAGVTYAVATLGTSTTPEHLQRIFRLVGEVVFCFDGDRAGRAAAWRALENAVGEVKQGRQVRFLFLPEGHDPDTLVREEGREAFEARLANAEPLSGYLIRELASRVDTGSVDGRARLVELARPLVRKIPSEVYRELLVQELASVVGMAAGRLNALLGGADTGEPGAGSSAPGRGLAPGTESGGPDRPRAARRVTASGPATGRGNLVRQAVTLLVHYPAAARVVGGQQIEAVGSIDRPGIPLLTELLAQLREDPPANTAGLLERWRDRPEYPSLAKLSVAVCLAPDEVGAAAELKSALNRLITEESPARRLDELMAKARDSTLDDAEKQELQALLAARGPAARRSPSAR
ncbi:MAG TPA: DNA primase [Steroidobacteraceae bacterium]|nr:DNA primase [Steroidobacteraceae bacterium]